MDYPGFFFHDINSENLTPDIINHQNCQYPIIRPKFKWSKDAVRRPRPDHGAGGQYSAGFLSKTHPVDDRPQVISESFQASKFQS